jgi:transposase-like protein
MAFVPVHCPYCHTSDVIKHGTTAQGKQRYRCQNANGPRHTFILDYRYHGRLPAIKQQIVDMALNGSGIRDIARVLKISPTTVIDELKKSITTPTCQSCRPPQTESRRHSRNHT